MELLSAIFSQGCLKFYQDLSVGVHGDGPVRTQPCPPGGTSACATSFTPIMRAHGYLINTPVPAVEPVPITTN